MESLSDKLKSLGVQVGTARIKPPADKPRLPGIESVVPGEVATTAYGETYVVTEQIPIDMNHGNVRLVKPAHAPVISQWSGFPDLGEIQFGNFLFLDTETTSLAGGTGTIPFMIGLGYLQEDCFKVIQLFLRSPVEESAQLAWLAQFADQFEVLVTYNGKSFDMPLLNSRYVLNGLTNPFVGKKHVDLLPLSRRIWKSRLVSRGLKDIEKEVLHFQRSMEDIPGWMVPEIYFEYARTGSLANMPGVFYHNKYDIVSLAALYVYLSQYLSDPTRMPENYSLDVMSIGKLYEDMGNIDQAIALYEQSINAGLPKAFLISTLHRYALIHRRSGQWKEAVDLWAKAADLGDMDACIDIAKVYEHQFREYDTALTWTEQAINLLNGTVLLPLYERKKRFREFEHRQSRLKGLLG
jgi:uncharacterized protein